MRLLFITQYYPPEIGAASNRIGYFAKFMAKKGHEVSVLTSAPNYPEGKIYPGFENKFSIRNEDGVRTVRTRVFLSAKKGFAGRLAHYLSFLVSSTLAKGKIEKPDVIFASSPPLFTGLIGVLFKKLWRVPLVLDIRDIWPESVESVGAVKSRKLLKQAAKLAHWIYKNADRISATSPGIKNKLPPQAAEKTEILPNGAELDIFRPDISGEKVREKYNLKDKFVILYTGNFGLAQAPEIFVDTASILQGPDVVFLMVGSGVLLQKIKNEAERKKLKNMIFTDSLPRGQMPGFIAAADVCIIPYKAADTFRSTLPSKMFDYMAGGKPIIINLKGEASDLIDKAGCGLLAKEENATSLAEKILELKQNRASAEKMGRKGREFTEKHYTREKTAEILQKVLEKFAKDGSTSSP